MNSGKGKKAQGLQAEQPAVYSKKQLMASKQFKNRHDLLEALLEDGKMYSRNEAEQTIKLFMKGKVN